jgi:hypothetical protein
VVQWAFRGRFSREHLMINRGRGDIRRLAAASAISGAGAVALALSLRWTPRWPAEPGPVPRAAGP